MLDNRILCQLIPKILVMAATSIEIPLLRSGQTNEVLEVDLNDLRANHDHIIDILTSEDGSLSLFLEFAVSLAYDFHNLMDCTNSLVYVY